MHPRMTSDRSPTFDRSLISPAAAPAVAIQLRQAITAWEKRTRISGRHVDLTVVRRHLGGKKGYCVRLLAGQDILTEWRRPTEDDAAACYLSVMRSLSELSGFRGITATSSDEETITSEMLERKTT